MSYPGLIGASELLARGKTGETCWCPAQLANKTAPLWSAPDSSCASWVLDAYENRRPGLIHPLSVFQTEDAVIAGRGNIVIDGAILASPEFMPFYWRRSLEDSAFEEIISLSGEKPRRLVGRTIVVIGHGIEVYGHVLLEMLSRLELLYMVGAIRRNDRLLLPKHCPKWLLTMLGDYYGFEASRISFFEPKHETVILDEALVPTTLWKDEQFHPAAASVFERMRDRLAVIKETRASSKLYVSRRGFVNPSSTQRSDHVVEQVETEFERCGFSIIHPERLSLSEQIGLFRNARVVAGPFGSGLHNAIFCKTGGRTLVLGYLNAVQTEISALTQGEIGYVTTEKGGSDVELAAIENFLADTVS